MTSGVPSGAPVTGIGWTYVVPPGVVATGTLLVYLENTSDVTHTKSSAWSTAINGMTVVHNAPTTLPNLTGPYHVVFSGGSSFTYSGGGLYVAFDWSYPVGNLGFSTVDCNKTLADGMLSNESNTSAPATLSVNSFRPETHLRIPFPDTDASVDYVLTLGEVPNGLVAPHVVRAIVSNRGGLDLSGLPVTLRITGAHDANDTQSIGSLAACGGQTMVSFAPFTPSALGSNTIDVFVPPDAVRSNDSDKKRLDTTVNRYAYKHPGSVPDTYAGFVGGPGELVAKFTTTSATQVDAVTFEFPHPSSTLSTFRVVIRAASSGRPGVELYSDAADRTVSTVGNFTYRLPSPVAVGPGSFFVGIRQTNDYPVGLGHDWERPIRSNTFYFSVTPPTGPWTDFSPGYDFKPNIGITLGACLVPLGVDVTPDGASEACTGDGIPLACTPTGGTGPGFTFQWTENGVDIPGATGDTYLATHPSPGSFAYNCKVSDDGGCFDVVDPVASTGSWSAPPSATVGGGGTICEGGSSEIQATLNGSGPWDLTWSDGFVQAAVAASPARRTVTPASTTDYAVTAVADSRCAGTASGSARVTVEPVPPETASGSAPGSILEWSSGSVLVWPPNPQAATHTLYRGNREALPGLLTPTTDSCVRYAGAPARAEGLGEAPASAEFFWYLVTGRGAGGCEGPAGNAAIAGSAVARTVDASGACP